MRTTFSAWKLADRNGRPARCLVSERDSGWQLVLWSGASIALWERCATEQGALTRADELRGELVQHGWRGTEGEDGIRPASPFRRACPECRQRAATVTDRRTDSVVLRCYNCERGWHDRERLATRDRRRLTRDQDDRRRAA
jgi:hypothetical protein